jgi:5-methylcytosine-specific restriction protein B
MKKWWTPNDNSTCIAIPKDELDIANENIFIPFFNAKFEYKTTIETPTKLEKSDFMNDSLNQILYGPPGTGKTFSTINIALKIIGENIEDKTREEIKDLFDTKMKEGQIVFTTFHQSMSYEDFIEGIKPIEPEKEGDPVTYRIELGVFRKLCVEAAFSVAQLSETKTTEGVLDFSIQYDNFVEGIQEKMMNGASVELETKTGGKVMVESISPHGNIIIKHLQGSRTYTISKQRLTKLHSVIPNLDDVYNINDQFRSIIGGSNSSAYWSVLNAIRKEEPAEKLNTKIRAYSFDDKKEITLSLTKSDFKNNSIKPFVLIIDEINRGNVSQIFGELITLIEEDKRLGKDEALEVTLPYSKDKFGVPHNLYIIGTMNTADRSVEAIDTALRRRFCFIEMASQPELIASAGKASKSKGTIDEISLPNLLSKINFRIEKLLDKDHQIGHSYFMSVSNLSELKTAFNNKIIPLLQEYFYGDYGKIGLVLGKGFFEPVSKTSEKVLADFYDEYDASDYEERIVYKLRSLSDMDDGDFKSAIILLMK